MNQEQVLSRTSESRPASKRTIEEPVIDLVAPSESAESKAYYCQPKS